MYEKQELLIGLIPFQTIFALLLQIRKICLFWLKIACLNNCFPVFFLTNIKSVYNCAKSVYKYTLLIASTWNLRSSFIVSLLLVGNANLRSHLLPFDAKSPGFVPWPSSQFHIFVFWCLQFSTWKHNHSRTQKLKLAFLIWQSHFLMSFM